MLFFIHHITNHIYWNKEKETAELILDWLGRFEGKS